MIARLTNIKFHFQILLSLLCMALADEQYTDRLHFDVTDNRESLMPKISLDHDESHTSVPLSPVKDRDLVEEVPLSDDVYSYNTKRTYDRVETYREHMDLFSKRNLKNPPDGTFDTLNAEAKLNNPGTSLPNQLTNVNDNYKYIIAKFNENNNENKKQERLPLTNTKKLENKKDEQESPSKMDEEEILTFQEGDVDLKLKVNATKDYHPEDRNENDEYTSYQNIPTNALNSNNDFVRNTVVNIDIISNTYNPQQPPYQFYQRTNSPSPVNTVHISIATNVPKSDVLINNQLRRNSAVPNTILPNDYIQQLYNNQNTQEFDRQSTSTNLPIRENKTKLMKNAAQYNPLFNNYYSPSSVLIYVNGQLILVPGIILNPQPVPVPIQNDDKEQLNIFIQSPSNTVFTNGPNQNSIERFNNLAPTVSNADPKSGVQFENSHPGPDTATNNNSGFYYKSDGFEKPIPYNQL
ncbi:unnamed protein product [Arctia plantaginis]|uniref:Uncharacterized protein n=1 Tax=Arctia plantaginis TaxID=874455 RepID=A0A8S1AFW4_ARCPL|nr:unnamed protein product [Arctia plantaginis]